MHSNLEESARFVSIDSKTIDLRTRLLPYQGGLNTIPIEFQSD